MQRRNALAGRARWPPLVPQLSAAFVRFTERTKSGAQIEREAK
jgi:hypothetical protein